MKIEYACLTIYYVFGKQWEQQWQDDEVASSNEFTMQNSQGGNGQNIAVIVQRSILLLSFLCIVYAYVVMCVCVCMHVMSQKQE